MTYTDDQRNQLRELRHEACTGHCTECDACDPGPRECDNCGEPQSRIRVRRDHVTLTPQLTVILVTATWEDGPHIIEGFGTDETDAYRNLADRIGDVLHNLTVQT